jgi:hypothetical protein
MEGRDLMEVVVGERDQVGKHLVEVVVNVLEEVLVVMDLDQMVMDKELGQVLRACGDKSNFSRRTGILW